MNRSGSSRGPGCSLFLTPTEAVLGLSKPAAINQEMPSASVKRGGERPSTTDKAVATAVLRMQLVSANPEPRIIGVEALPGKVNYFRGNDPKQWRTNIPTYADVGAPALVLVTHRRRAHSADLSSE